MGIQVREKSIEEMNRKISEMKTPLNKIAYLESALKEVGADFEIKKFLWNELARLYEERKMFEKAARAMANKAGLEVMFRERTDSYIRAAELYVKVGKVDDAENIFVKAMRDVNKEQKLKIQLARKNLYLLGAREFERKGKRAGAVKFYEALIKMRLEDIEKKEIEKKLIEIYKALGRFREARLLEGS